MFVTCTHESERFDAQVPLLIVGGGAAGLCAALAAKEAGIDAVVIERDAVPSGSTALSAGLIPAAGTRFQRDKGIGDSPELFAADIQRKAHGESDPAIVEVLARGAGPLIEWLADRYGLPFDVVDNFNYSGHSALRMHGLPSRSGRELIDRLRSAAEANDIVILTERIAERLLLAAEGGIAGIEIVRGDGARERIGCDALILACNGYGGNPELVRRFIPEVAARFISVLQLDPQSKTRPFRTSSNAICCAVEGSGETQVGDKTILWRERDIFTLPQGNWIEHKNGIKTSRLFIASDRDLMARLGLLDEEYGG